MASFPDQIWPGLSTDEARTLSDHALGLARSMGASYADLRFVGQETEDLEVKNGTVETVNSDHSRGFGVRVLYDGAWGFSSSSLWNRDEIERVTREAVVIARASARVKGQRPVTLSPLDPVQDSWATPVIEDPFNVSLEDRIDLLMDASSILQGVEGVRVATASMGLFRENKTFASTDGSFITQSRTETGAGLSAMAMEAGEVQKRSFPSSFGGDWKAMGFEHVRSIDLRANAEKCGQEAVELLKAQQCPSGSFDLVLEPSQMALQIHESCGHPIELDRVFGMEASFAGTSFLTTEKLSSFQYGSDQCNITADATITGALGTFGYDDDGVAAESFPVMSGGRFVNYLTGRDTGSDLAGILFDVSLGEDSSPSLRSNGTMRANGHNRIPLVRMTNVNLDPGDWSLDEIIKDTDNGIYMATNKSWSIDDRRTNFQFGCEAAWEIKDGQLGRMLKNPTYTGITPEFWGNLDAVAGPAEWKVWGLPNCGKGEPPQSAHVGHGASPSRFRGVNVGVGKW